MRKAKLVSENMTKHLITVAWNDSMERAFRLMEEHSIRHLPVTDKEGFVIGILSDHDVNRAMNSERPGFAEGCEVSEFMSWPAITVDEHTKLRDVAEGMIDEKVSSFLVTRNGKEVVGIVTSEDLLRFLAASLREDEGEKASLSLKNLPYAPVVHEAMRELGAAGI